MKEILESSKECRNKGGFGSVRKGISLLKQIIKMDAKRKGRGPKN